MDHKCIYCGDDTQKLVRDHLTSVTSSRPYRDYSSGDTVLACVECNSLLGSVYITTIEERALYLVDKYLSKYKKLLKTPDWTEDEISELGARMASMVKANLLMRSVVSDKLDHLSTVSSAIYNDKGNWSQISTMEKKHIYSLVHDFMSSDSQLNVFISESIEKYGLSKKEIETVLNEKDHFGVITTYKYERKFPLDVSLKSIRKELIKIRKK